MEPIPTKRLVTNFTIPTNFDHNDQLSSNSTPVVHKAAVLLAKNLVSLAKSKK